MVFVVGAVALVIILWLLLRRRDSRAATIRSLPKYGTTEATELQKAIVDQGPAALVSPHSGPSTLLAIEPARGEDYFRARLGNGGRLPIPPVAKLRRARSKPVRPKPFAAPRARPGFAPPQTVLVPASRCRKIYESSTHELREPSARSGPRLLPQLRAAGRPCRKPSFSLNGRIAKA